MTTGKPSPLCCLKREFANSLNSTVASPTTAFPFRANVTWSWTLHDVHDPQSETARITPSHVLPIWSSRSCEASSEGIPLLKCSTRIPERSCMSFDNRANRTSAFDLLLLRNPIFLPRRSFKHVCSTAIGGGGNDVGFKMIVSAMSLIPPCFYR